MATRAAAASINAHLHRVETGLHHAEADAARAEHRVELVPGPRRVVEVALLGGEPGGGLLDRELLDVREELVERRIEQPHGDGQPVHRFEDLLEVGLLHDAQLLERGHFFLRRVGEDHAAHDRQPVLAEEHVLGPAEADAFGAELTGVGGVGSVVRVGPDLELALPDLIRPREDRLELLRRLAGAQRDRSENDLTGGAVERDHVAFAHREAVRRERLAVDLHGFGADDRGDAPAARDDGRVAHEPAAGGEDALGHLHAVHVFRARLAAHEHDLLAAVRGISGVVRGEVRAADGCARRCRETSGDDREVFPRELRVQDLVEMLGRHAHHGFGPRDLPALLLGHLDGHAQRGRAGALADARLQHPELALLDGELGVAHVAVVLLEPSEDREQFLVDRGEVLRQRVEVFRVADARHDVLALRVDQEVAVRLVLTGGGVAREADAGAAVVVAVAEHHRLHVDGGAEIVADALTHAIRDGARSVPAAEHGFDRALQLHHRVLREGLAGLLAHDVLVALTQPTQRLGADLCIRRGAVPLLGRVEQPVEDLAVEVEHDAPVHRDEAAVGVVGEALVVRLLGEAFDRIVVEPEVEDRVHHPGHGELGA